MKCTIHTDTLGNIKEVLTLSGKQSQLFDKAASQFLFSDMKDAVRVIPIMDMMIDKVSLLSEDRYSTGEPKLFYKTTNGLTESYKEALLSSGGQVELGFKLKNQGFLPIKISSTSLNNDSVNGVINNAIVNGQLAESKESYGYGYSMVAEGKTQMERKVNINNVLTELSAIPTNNLITTQDGLGIIPTPTQTELKDIAPNEGLKSTLLGQNVDISLSQEDADLEKQFTQDLIDGKVKLEDFEYYSDYVNVMEKESPYVKGKTLFVGGGSLSLSSILLKDQGIDVTNMDMDPEAIKLAEQNRSDIPNILANASTFNNYNDYDTIILALEAGITEDQKLGILENISNQVGKDTVIIVRGSKQAQEVITDFPSAYKAVEKFMNVTNQESIFENLSWSFVGNIKTPSREDIDLSKVVYRSLRRNFDSDYSGIQYYSENENYSKVFGNITKKFNIQEEDVLDLNKWNQKLSQENKDFYNGNLFTVHSTYLNPESEDFGYKGLRDEIYTDLGIEEYKNFQIEFNNARIIKGYDSGNESQLVYAVRDKNLISEINNDIRYSAKKVADKNLVQSVAEASDSGFLVPEIGIQTNPDAKIDIQSLKERTGYEGDIPTISIKDLEGIPMTFTISDELTTGDTVNPHTGNVINKLYGGLGFNVDSTHKDFHWANVDKAGAETQLKIAQTIYNANKELFNSLWNEGKIPQNFVPVAVVKMSGEAINSNEALLRLGYDTIKSFKPFNLKKNESKLLKSFLGSLQLKNKSLFDKLKSNNYTSVNNLMEDVFSHRDLGDKEYSLSDIKSLIDVILNSKTQFRTDIVNLGFDTKTLNSTSTKNILVDPSYSNVGTRDIISITGIDVINPEVKQTQHPNYPWGLKGGLIGVMENPVNLIDVFASFKGSVISNLRSNKSLTNMLAWGIPTGMGLTNIAFRGDVANTELKQEEVLAGYLRQVFPGVNFNLTQASWDFAIKNPEIQKFVNKNGDIEGFTNGKSIFINPQYSSNKVLLHEAGHIWGDYMEKTSPLLWNKGLELAEETPEFEKAKEIYGDTKLAREEALMELIASKGNTILDEQKKSRFEQWLTDVWKFITTNFLSSKQLLQSKSIDTITLDEFVEAAVVDLLSGQSLDNTIGEYSSVIKPTKVDKFDFVGSLFSIAPKLSESPYSSIEEFQDKIKNGKWGMLTGENPDVTTPYDEIANYRANSRASSWLKDKGYQPIEIFGKYGVEENSFFVDELTKDHALEFAKTFTQDSVATNEALIYRDGSYSPIIKNSESFGGNYEDYFSVINIKGQNLSFKIDYSNERLVDKNPENNSTTFNIPDAGKNITEKDKETYTPEGTTDELLKIPMNYKNSRLYPFMTEDGEGNFVFYHYSSEKRDVLKSGPGTGVTNNSESGAWSFVGGTTYYYTRQKDRELVVRGENIHEVKVPKERVYDITKDRQGFYELALNRFKSERGNLAFTPNLEVAYIAKIAQEHGYTMVVAGWEGKARGNSIVELKPTDYALERGNITVEPFKNSYPSNEEKYKNNPSILSEEFKDQILNSLIDNGDVEYSCKA